MIIRVRPSNDREFIYERSGQQFLNWARETSFCDKLNVRRPAAAVTVDEAATLLMDAAAELAEVAGSSPSPSSKGVDLVAISSMAKIVGPPAEVSQSEKRMKLTSLLIGIAHEYCSLPNWQITALHELAGPTLSAISAASKRHPANENQAFRLTQTPQNEKEI